MNRPLFILVATSLFTCASLPGKNTELNITSSTVYTTARDSGQKLAEGGGLTFTELPPLNEKEQSIFVDPGKQFQTIVGIGGALTDAAAETFYKLPPDKQKEVLRAYFDAENGIGYSLGRVPINSSDFSSQSHVYVKERDADLTSFDVEPDRKYRLPFIKAALAEAGANKVTLFASPWSPPAWMKDNNDVLHGGKLLPEYFSAWANYYVKFVKAYKDEGVPIWGVTVQNEPMAVQTWESCNYSAEDERDFIKNYLGPAFAKSGLSSKKIIIWDHNRSFMYRRAQVVLDDPEAAKYVWGVGFHWYTGDDFDNVRRVTEAYPKVNVMLTEACLYPFDLSKTATWDFGETYAKSMIHDFNNGAVGWTDWNVLLDEKGGPNHVQNYCFAPIIGDTRTGELHYLNAYYYIGHFSRFVRPGARRIICSPTTDGLLATAFLNEDGKIAVVVMNATDTDQPFNLWIGNESAKTDSPAHSILTYVIATSRGSVAARQGQTAARADRD
jgi:glucosylceramidase